MTERMKQAQALRDRADRHYNCCQSVLIPFCRSCGLSEEEAYSLGAHFGAGMKYGSTCGAVTGALMVLGLAGRDEETARTFRERFAAAHGALECDPLLALTEQRGEERKQGCDRLVCRSVELVEGLLGEK